MAKLWTGALIAILVVVVGSWVLAPGGNVPTTKKACMSYQKQLGVGVLLYASDHDDRYPLAESWRSVADHQPGSRWRCPESKAPFTYAMNRKLSGLAESKIADPFQTVLLFDCDSNEKDRSGGPESVSYHHHGVAVMISANGSARTLKPSTWKR